MAKWRRGIAMLGLALACGPTAPASSEGSSGEGSSGEGTPTSTSGTASGDPPTSTGGGTTSGASTGDTGTADGGGSGTSTGGAELACEAACGFFARCHAEDEAACVDFCPGERAGRAFIGEACVQAQDVYWACVGGLSCADEANCDEAEAAAHAACVLPEVVARCDRLAECSGMPDPDCAWAASLVAASLATVVDESCAKALLTLDLCQSMLSCEELAAETGCEQEDTAFNVKCAV